ncbi:F-box domain containing protein [Tanacetum coccineum]
MIVESDRLSSLPDDLIHKILSFIDKLDAIKTSCLSSRWRFIWITMPCLNFPNDDFFTLLKLSKFFSGRDNQREVSSMNLSFRGKSTKGFVGKILEYASSHNVRLLNLTCLIESAIIEFPLSLISSKTLEHLSLKMDNSNRTFNQRGSIALTSMWEVPALTTLHLDGIILSRYNTDNFSGLISKKFLISAPDLAYLLLDGHDHVNFSGDDFNSLEKVDICIDHPSKKEPHKLVGLLQRLHSVKSLTLNLEILEILSASAELMSHQPSPFANLESLKIYPKRFRIGLKEKVDIFAEVKNYLLDGDHNSKNCIAELQLLLEQEKADIETSKDHTEQENAPESYNAKMQEQQNAHAENQMQEIRKLLTELPALTRVGMQPCFTSLCAEAAIVMSKITYSMKAQFDEYQSCLNVGFHELATTLQSFP